MIQLKDFHSRWNEPEVIDRDEPLKEALYIMQSNDFSQLPVVHPNRHPIKVSYIKGILTWKSILEKISDENLTQPEIYRVSDFMTRDGDEVILCEDDHLLKAIDKIGKNDFVLVKDVRGMLKGILTTFDITRAFSNVIEPYIRIGSIEYYLRKLVQDNYILDEYRNARVPSDNQREIKSVEDLTLGEIIRFFQKEEHWEKIKRYTFSRKRFIKDLQAINYARNQYFHFRFPEKKKGEYIEDGLLDKNTISLMANISRLLEKKISKSK